MVYGVVVVVVVQKNPLALCAPLFFLIKLLSPLSSFSLSLCVCACACVGASSPSPFVPLCLLPLFPPEVSFLPKLLDFPACIHHFHPNRAQLFVFCLFTIRSRERKSERAREGEERKKEGHLQNHALLLLLLPGEQGGTGGVLKHLAHALVGLGRTLEVLLGTDLLTNVLSLLRRNRLLRCLVQLLDSLLVESQVLLAAYQDDGQALAEVQHF